MLTKEQRHEVYKKALEVLKMEIKTCPFTTFLCPTLNRIVFREFGIKVIAADIIRMKELFPEFFSLKPSNNFFYHAGWWSMDETGNKERVKVIKSCIKLTK